MKKKNLIALIVCLLLVAVTVSGLFIYDRSQRVIPEKITEEEAEKLIYDQVKNRLSDGLSIPLASELCKRLVIRAESIDYKNREIAVKCSYETVDILSTYKKLKNNMFETAYKLIHDDSAISVTGTKILIQLSKQYKNEFMNSSAKTGAITVHIYQTSEGNTVYFDDDTVDALLGGALSMKKDAETTEEITVDGAPVSIKRDNTLRRGVVSLVGLSNYDRTKPDISTPLVKKWNALKNDFYRNFIEKDRWVYLASGLLTTLEITALALVLGTVLGFIAAIIRCTHDKEGKLGILSKITSLYVTIVRGTPVMVQLLIIYFVILLPIGIEKFTAAVLCFGLNSGAYVCEIIRGGIMSVDNGQFEAGRSLGFNYIQTMSYIVMPQAFKAVLPALCNEFIALLKETSVAFYIGVSDLTRGGLKIRSITYSNFMPLIAIALIYLVLVLILTKLVRILERRLRRSER